MKTGETLPRSFYSKNTIKVAKRLLGKYLVRKNFDGRIVARILEVEAYGESDDRASHTY